ncbi:YceD family protein [Luteimonas sp. A478]
MSAELSRNVDWRRAVAAGRELEGQLPLAGMARLCDLLFDAEGQVQWSAGFGRDELDVPFVEVRVDARLPLECRRTLQRFEHPVQIVQRYGIIRDEADEAALPEGYEALLPDGDGYVDPVALVEDELILAVPLIPVSPGSESVERDWPVHADEEMRANPFSALAELKKKL